MKKGQVPAYAGTFLFVLIFIFLVVPLIPQQKIVFTLQNGKITDLKFIETKETGASIILEHFKSKEIAGTKVEVIGYIKAFERCLYNYKPYNLKCISSINETIWTTPNANIEIKVQLEPGEYIVRVTSFVYEPTTGQMRERDTQEFSFRVD